MGIIKETFMAEIWNKGFIARVKFFLALIVIGLIVVGVIYKDRLKAYRDETVYPKAKNMPPALKISVDDALKKLQKALKTKSRDLANKLQPGLTKEKVEELAEYNNIKLPEALVKLYMWHDGSKLSGQGKLGEVHDIYSLENAISALKQIRELSKSATKLQRRATGLPIQHDSHMDNLFHIYSNDAYYTLSYDLGRKPQEGAYVLTDSRPYVYCFFPSLQNAITALAECYETGAFKSLKKKSAVSLDSYKFEADNAAVIKIMKKYGSYAGKKQ